MKRSAWSSPLTVKTLTHIVAGGLVAVANCSISFTLASSERNDNDDREDLFVRREDRDDFLVEAYAVFGDELV